MPPAPRGTTLEIAEIDEKQAHAELRRTYGDGEAAIKFFAGYVSQREKALKAFDELLDKDEALMATFSRNPVGTLNERGLLGPLDKIDIEGLLNPFNHFPWPLPWCRPVCRIEATWHVHWVCIKILGFRFCWPRFHLHFRWVCRWVCS